MGKDKNKAEKKRLKAQIKHDKKRAKMAARAATGIQEAKATPEERQKMGDGDEHPRELEKETRPWYKNPEWVRAIAAIASLIVAIIAIFLSFYLT